MKARALLLVFALGLHGSAQAQSIDELKKQLDQALKTIQDLQNRVNALEQQKRPRRQPPQRPTRSTAANTSRRHRGGRTGGRAAKYGRERRTRCEQSAPRDLGQSTTRYHLRLQEDESGVGRD